MGWPPSLKPKQRLQLSLTMDMVDTEAMEATEVMVDTALEDTGATMASERPRLSLTMDTVDTEATVVDTEAMEDTVLDTAGATMASVRLRLSLTMDTVDTRLPWWIRRLWRIRSWIQQGYYGKREAEAEPYYGYGGYGGYGGYRGGYRGYGGYRYGYGK